MLMNRTNLTLSALAFSNGLNLGTRSLAANASVNDGDQTLRTRHSHHDVMRERMVWYVVSSIPKPMYAIPAIPGSFFQQQQRPSSCLTSPQGEVAVDVSVIPVPRPADLVGRPEPCVRVGVTRILPVSVASSERSSSSCERSSETRPGRKDPVKPDSKRAARRAASAAAAISAASTGK